MGRNKRRRRWGSIRQLPSGRWQARYPGPSGALYPAPHTFATSTDADLWLVDKEAEIRRVGWYDPDAGLIPLGDYVDQWLANRPDLAPGTVQRYERLLRLQIRPNLGDVPLADLTTPVVRHWRAELLASGVGDVAVAKAYRLLKTVLNTALDDDLIRRNPCRIKGAATETRHERTIPTMPQVVALSKAVGERWRALILLAAFGALRWGELAALRRRNVDIDAMTVRVDASMTDINGQLIEGPPKSRAGRRVVHLPMVLEPILREHLKRFAEPGRDGWVFVGARGGQLRRPGFQATWSKGTTAVGLSGLRFHDLRHAGATWAAQAGATIRELQDRLGQSSHAAAMIYQHVAAGRGREIADALSRQAEDSFSDLARSWHEDDDQSEET